MKDGKLHEPAGCPQTSFIILWFTAVESRRCVFFSEAKSYGCSCHNRNFGARARTVEHFGFCKHDFSQTKYLTAASNLYTRRDL